MNSPGIPDALSAATDIIRCSEWILSDNSIFILVFTITL
jgi:hypothetical protein